MQAVAILTKNGKTIKVPCSLKTTPKGDYKEKIVNPIENFLISEIDKRMERVNIRA